MARDFFTSSPATGSETLTVCQKKMLSNELAKTSRKANRPRHRRANLSAKKWNTSAKANMARVRQNRPSRLACRRHGAPGWTCRRQSVAEKGRKNRPNAILPKAGGERKNGHRARVRARQNGRCVGKAARPRRGEVCRVMQKKLRAVAVLLRVLARRKKPPARGRKDASPQLKLQPATTCRRS